MNEPRRQRYPLQPVRDTVQTPRTEAMVALFGALAYQGSRRGPKPGRNPYRRRKRR